MTLLISVEGLIMVLVIEGLPRFKQTGNYLPSEAALGCMGWCFLQGRQCPPWGSLVLGMVAHALQTLGRGPTSGGSRGARGEMGKAWGEGEGRLCYYRCVCGVAV